MNFLPAIRHICMTRPKVIQSKMYRENPIIRIANVLTNVSIDDFDSRLKLQKIGFLAQELGAHTGFAFNWYRRGPYSPSLTRMLYSAEELGMLRIDNVELTASEKKIVRHLRELLGRDINDSRTLELFASVWYFLPNSGPSKRDKERIVEVLVENKPQFERHELLEALERIIAFREKMRIS